MIDVFSLAEQDTRLQKASVREYAGPCPDRSCRCQTDGFRVKWAGEKWVWMCRGCWDSQEYLSDKGRKRGWGDAIDYLRHYKGKKYREAKALVEAETDGNNCCHPRVPQEGLDWHSAVWQEKTARYVGQASEQLQRVQDGGAAAYCRSRGLRDEIIKEAHLGYDEDQGIPRLVIPVSNADQYFAVFTRDLRPGVPPNEQKKDILGGTKSELYLADCLKRKRPTVLCEDSLSALTVVQEAGDLVNVVATCGASCGKQVKWLARLARQPLVLVALDADKGGDENAQWWVERLPNAVRLRPLLKDINDMLMDGWDIRAWIEAALSTLAESENAENFPQFDAEMPLCCTCLDDGMERQALPDDYQGLMYCEEHHPGIRDTGEESEEQSLEDVSLTSGDTSPEDDRQQLLSSVNRMLAALPGGWTASEPFHGTPKEYIQMRYEALQQGQHEQKAQRHKEIAAVQQKKRRRDSIRRESIPGWLIPNSPEWNEHIDFLCLGPVAYRETMKELGLRPQMTREQAIAEMQERRQAWLASNEKKG